jgi:uncharacterized protein
VERIPDDLVVSPAEAAELGGRLLAEDHPFHAHEVFEAAWKSVPEEERELWRGLAQIAVGLTHARRGNASGAAALRTWGASCVTAGAAPAPETYAQFLDPGYVATQAASLANRIERDGVADLTEADFRLRLVVAPLG